jgi:aminopeptidase-like protein
MEEIVETPQAGPGEPTKIFPELLERFRSKKFGFKEGLILQLCNGKHSLEDIAKESNLKEEEVLEVINLYQKRGWLIIHT